MRLGGRFNREVATGDQRRIVRRHDIAAFHAEVIPRDEGDTFAREGAAKREGVAGLLANDRTRDSATDTGNVRRKVRGECTPCFSCTPPISGASELLLQTRAHRQAASPPEFQRQ